jgi:hypothetical protein
MTPHMQLNRRVVPLLVIVIVAIAGVVGMSAYRQHTAQANTQRAQTLARDVARPSDATASKACRGDGLVSCWLTTSTPKQAITIAQGQLRAAHSEPGVNCSQVPSKAVASGTADLCSAVVHVGAHATTVFAFPYATTVNGVATRGTLVSVLAS